MFTIHLEEVVYFLGTIIVMCRIPKYSPAPSCGRTAARRRASAELDFRYEANHLHGRFGIGEVQREADRFLLLITLQRQLRFRAVLGEQTERIALQHLGGQGDFHLTGGLGQLTADFEGDAHQDFAAFRRAHAHDDFPGGQLARDRLRRGFRQHQAGAVADLAAHRAEGELRGLIGTLQLVGKEGTGDGSGVLAVPQAGRAVRAVGVGRPLTVPVAQRGNDRIPVAVPAAGAGIGGVALRSAGRGRGLFRYAVVAQCRDLLIGGVGAALAGAGLVGLPADFRAGRGLRVVGFEVVGVGVNLAVVALAHSAVGRGDAGGGGGFRVVCGFPVNHMTAASIGDLCRVLGLGGFHMGGCGRANVVARVFFSVSTAA